MTASPPSAVPKTESPEDILDALLFSVSHDLRSPLLTLSLSAELIRESVDAAGDANGVDQAGNTAVALDALKQGAEDLERMLSALTTVSRARRREQEIRTLPVRVLLGGHVVSSNVEHPEGLTVRVDATPVRELIDRLCGEDPAEIRLGRTDTHVILRIPSRADLPVLDGSPLIALARSLQLWAGTIVEDLASLQLQLARQAVPMELADGAVYVWLPVSAGSSR